MTTATDDCVPSYTHWQYCKSESCICQEFYRCDECLQLVHFTEAVVGETVSTYSLVTFPVACKPCAEQIDALA